MAEQIDSSKLIPIEEHFRVSAGPGAGKTYWLIQHMKNVLCNSDRLAKMRRIACITYTNTAVETIQKRFGCASDRIEISTIHSFLYKHVLKPYATFIAIEFNLNVSKIDGHDDTILSNFSFLQELKAVTKQFWINDNDKLVEAIGHAKWVLLPNGVCELKPDYPRQVDGLYLKKETYFEYKKMAWSKGVIHHDDVLFFCFELINRYPFILDVIRAKFPYFFIDEFQDSSPIQKFIIEKIGESETIIGVIGDKAQSIYKFQGADVQQFTDFFLSGLKDYEMLDNRRSTNQIIDILNVERPQFPQNKYKNEDGDIPVILVGNMFDAYKKSIKLSHNEKVYTLSRTNITSNIMKRTYQGDIPSRHLFEKLMESDSNKYRPKYICACIRAVEHAKLNKFKDALKELKRVFKKDEKITDKDILNILLILLNKYSDYSNKSLIEFYSFVFSNVIEMAKFKKGAAKDFYTNHSYSQLALCVNVIDDDSMHRTIHKAKGAEFDNVLLLFEDETKLDSILKPDTLKDEEHRICYVAISRAKKRLFISVPNLNQAYREKLEHLPCKIDIEIM